MFWVSRLSRFEKRILSNFTSFNRLNGRNGPTGSTQKPFYAFLRWVLGKGCFCGCLIKQACLNHGHNLAGVEPFQMNGP